MATESTVVTTTPADTGLKRELGLIGAAWTSETSIIGSGWLFAPLTAATLVGGAAVLDWVIAGVVVMNYTSHWWHSIYNSDTGNVTGVGFVMTIVLMAIFVAVNFLAMRIFARVNSAVTWWKIAVPLLAIIVLLFKFHGGNFSPPGEGFMPGGVHGLFAALPVAGIIFAYSGFEQADQLAGEIKDPGRNLPRAIIIAVLIGTIIYTLLQVALIGAMPANLLSHGWLNFGDKAIEA